MSELRSISSADMTAVDTAAHVNDTDNVYIQTTIDGKRKVRRVSPAKLRDNVLASMGLAVDGNGQLGAIVND